MDEKEREIIEEIVLFGINNEPLYLEGLRVKERISKHKEYNHHIVMRVWAAHVTFILQEYRKINGRYNNIVPNKLPDLVRFASAEKLIEMYED